MKEVAASLKTSPEDVPARVASLSESVRKLEKDLAEAKKALALGGSGGGSAEIEEFGGVPFLGQLFEGLDPKDLRSLINDAKARLGEGVAAVVTVNDGKASVAVGVTESLFARFDSVALVKVAVAALGGQGGGGRPDMAQGGGPNGAEAAAALDAIRSALSA